MHPLISFIIPSYNQVDFLQQAINSIHQQAIAESRYEIIVMDGGSRDGSIELLKSNPGITYWESTGDRGQGHALNKALLRASGEFIGWLNADDYYLPGSAHKAISLFEANKDIDVVYGQCIDVDASGNFIRKTPVSPWSQSSLLDACIIAQPASFFRASFFKKNGPLREDLHLTLDYEYWLRAMHWIRPFFITEVLAANRVHDQAKSTRAKIAQMMESARVVYHYSKIWNPVWLRRIASAKSRQLLDPMRLSHTPCRPLLSFVLYYCLQIWMRIGWKLGNRIICSNVTAQL